MGYTDLMTNAVNGFGSFMNSGLGQILSVGSNFLPAPWKYILPAIGTAGAQTGATNAATAANRAQYDALLGSQAGSTGGAINYGGLDPDTNAPIGLSFDAVGQLDAGYRRLLNQMKGEDTAALTDYGDYQAGVNRRVGQYGTDVMAEYDRAGNIVLDATKARSNDVLNSYDRGYTDLLGNARTRQDTGMAMLEGYGDQQRKDLDKQYDASGNASAMEMGSRGFGSGSMLTGARQGNERERADAKNRLNESINSQKLNTYGSLSGDVLNTMASGLSNRTNLQSSLSGDVVNTLANNAAGRTNLYGSLMDLQRSTKDSTEAGRLDLLNNQGARYTDLLAKQEAGRMGLMTDAWGSILNTVAGVSNPYPSSAPYLALESGLGSAQAAETYADKVNSQNKTWWDRGGSGLFGMGAGAGIGALGAGLTPGGMGWGQGALLGSALGGSYGSAMKF